MTVGGNPVTLDNPQPFGPAYFVLRNNDPAVDGFLLSRNVDFPQPVSVHIPGLSPTHELDFLRTFNDGTPLPSLDLTRDTPRRVGTHWLAPRACIPGCGSRERDPHVTRLVAWGSRQIVGGSAYAIPMGTHDVDRINWLADVEWVVEHY
jgi:hypothetical protein